MVTTAGSAVRATCSNAVCIATALCVAAEFTAGAAGVAAAARGDDAAPASSLDDAEPVAAIGVICAVAIGVDWPGLAFDS